MNEADRINLKGLALEGFEIPLHRGGTVWAAAAPMDRGGGYVIRFTSKDESHTYLALSREAFDALQRLYDLLTQPTQSVVVVLAELMGARGEGDWHIVKPEQPGSEAPKP